MTEDIDKEVVRAKIQHLYEQTKPEYELKLSDVSGRELALLVTATDIGASLLSAKDEEKAEDAMDFVDRLVSTAPRFKQRYDEINQLLDGIDRHPNRPPRSRKFYIMEVLMVILWIGLVTVETFEVFPGQPIRLATAVGASVLLALIAYKVGVLRQAARSARDHE